MLGSYLSLSLLLNTFLYIGVALALLVLGNIVFKVSTKYDENKLINEEGNIAVAIRLWGKMIGLALVLAGAIKNSVDLIDLIVWGIVGVIAQLLGYIVLEYMIMRKVQLSSKVEQGNIAVAISLFGISIVIGLIISASLTY